MPRKVKDHPDCPLWLCLRHLNLFFLKAAVSLIACCDENLPAVVIVDGHGERSRQGAGWLKLGQVLAGQPTSCLSYEH